MKPKSFLLVAGLTLALNAVVGPAEALEDSQIITGAQRIGHVSLGDLESACGNSGGDFYETAEEYMCVAESGWIYCEKTGDQDCVGETTNSKGKVGNRSLAQIQKTRAALPAATAPRPGQGAGTPAKKPGAPPAKVIKLRNEMRMGVTRNLH